ncbi:hypothetical protein HYFRA_00007618 [Hymenoscyphus fraxineus]|uniref:RWD domain-containing protein n=1 Tax=Hymenoscyphus fraxineus TaxID=746836 RepID=A0A9N9KS50_9HELO|nr:hypothetical protein HYFRA_00007618 [Hymenoscyphus fraxineus]
MSEDLLNEIEAINSIYGDDSLVADGVNMGSDDAVYVLHLQAQHVSLRIQFPSCYPKLPPSVLGAHSSGERKGEAAQVVERFRKAVGRVFQPGEVCLFDAIEDVNTELSVVSATEDTIPPDDSLNSFESDCTTFPPADESVHMEPPWALSDVVVEMKSVFVARSSGVSSPDQAAKYLQHLLDSDKKVRSATHNITAWRIRGENGVTFQDCDDDGETAAGGRLLHLMQLMELWDVMVVVTRWYGGHQLGPKRFSIINAVARDSFVKGGFFKEDTATKKKGKR